jgi:putative transposase
MDGSIRLSTEECKILLTAYRNGPDVHASRRAQIVLLLNQGRSYREIVRVAFASSDFIADCVRRYREGGAPAVLQRENPRAKALPLWLVRIVQWLMTKTPQDFGYFRNRWSCDMLAEVLAWETGERISGETIRRGLHRMDFVWRRPRPIIGLTDPEYDTKLQRIQQLLTHLPADETAVFQDEVDVHLNPKIGCCWMVRGQQAEVVTPGNNVKRHLSGSLVWRTGTMIVSSPGTRRNTELFLAHLDDLRRRLRGYRMIHVICDNASFHKCRAVAKYLERWGHRITLHFLPKYAPETNPIERVWWHLHETITRNHRCQTIEELLDEALSWLYTRRTFAIETSLYPAQAA